MRKVGMFGFGKAAAIAIAAMLAGGASPAISPIDVPEPVGLYSGPQRGYTPATLSGATVIDLAALEKLLAGETDKPVLLDVIEADRKPAGLPATTSWLPTHRSIPGAVWLPGAGAAPLTPSQEAAFFRYVETLTGGDRSKPVVTFCRPDCWGSWNAGKRLVQAGYSRVYWFPLGVEGWQDVHETKVVKADSNWVSVAREPVGKPTGEVLR